MHAIASSMAGPPLLLTIAAGHNLEPRPTALRATGVMWHPVLQDQTQYTHNTHTIHSQHTYNTHTIHTHHHHQAYGFEGYWRDVGNIKSFYDENLRLAEAVRE